MFFWDISMIILIPGLLLAMYAQAKVSSTYNRYKKVTSHSGYTGAQFARKMLNDNGLYDVTITQVSGRMSDHYDPRANQVRLSAEVYNGTSIASLGIALPRSRSCCAACDELFSADRAPIWSCQ